MNSQMIKALKEVLEELINNSSNVFLIGHNGPDFDSIGACIGLYTLAEFYGKKAYIIVDDEESKIEPGVKRIMDENKDRFHFIKKNDFQEILKKNSESLVRQKSLLIISDVNKKHMISIGDSLDKVEDIIIIDHHGEDENTINTPYRYINEGVSSASEVVARILLLSRVKIPKEVATSLLAGISLDTKRFKHNTTSKTHDVAEKLINNGANMDYVNNLFLEEFESFCRISNLIINGTIIRKYSENSLSPIHVSFTLNRNSPHTIYLKEDYAKAADRMMKFNGIDAAFALGYVDEEHVHISARSGKRVNVGTIMKEMKGGGNHQSAGALLLSDDIFNTENELMSKVLLGLPEEENIVEEPQVVKVKQIINK